MTQSITKYLQSFFWGIITAGMALTSQILLIILAYKTIDINKWGFVSVLFLAIFVLIEELYKYLIIVKKIFSPLLTKRKLILNSWIAGIGFSTVELFSLYQKRFVDNFSLDFFNLTGVLLLHIFTFGFLGYRLTIKKNNTIDFFAITIVFILHFIYNFSALYSNNLTFTTRIAVIATLSTINFFTFFIVNKKLAPSK